MRPYRQGISAQVAAWIRRQSERFTTADVSGKFSVSSNNASQVLTRLWRAGQVFRLQRGVYQRPT